jgi:hypothetical protein
MPTRSENYSTPGLDEAAKAVVAVDALRREDAAHESMQMEMDIEEVVLPQQDKKAKVVLLMSDSDRYVQIRDRAKAEARSLTEFEYDWLGDYYQSPTGKLYMKLEGDLRKKYGMAEHQSAGA